MDEKITGYHVFFVIFTFFLLSGFVIGTALSYESDMTFGGLLSDEDMLTQSYSFTESAENGSDSADGTESINIDVTTLLTTLANAFFLDFRYLLAIFLCGFTAFAPIFGIFILLIRGAVFGYSVSALYHMIFGGLLFVEAQKTVFMCYFIAGAVNIMLCINLSCIANEFSKELRDGVCLKKLIIPDETVKFPAGRFIVIFLLISFIQLSATALRFFAIRFLR